MDLPGCYDPDGQPISLEAWAEKFKDVDARTLAEDPVAGNANIRTVWRGIYDPTIGRDLFGTAVISGNAVTREVRQYHTRDEALAGHREIIAEWPPDAKWIEGE